MSFSFVPVLTGVLMQNSWCLRTTQDHPGPPLPVWVVTGFSILSTLVRKLPVSLKNVKQ